MRLSIFCSAAAAIMCFIGCFLGLSGADVDNPGAENAGAEPNVKACDNFYKHVCESHKETFPGTSPSSLRGQLYKKVKDILEEEDIQNGRSLEVESDQVDNAVHIRRMARKFYDICVKDKHKESKDDVKKALTKMLKSLGIDNWPLTANTDISTETSTKILERTGLRPFATIAPVPDRKEPWYIVAVNGPFPRFGAYPDTMKTIKHQTKKYNAYKTFIQSILNLYFGSEGESAVPVERSDEDSSYYTRYEDYEKTTLDPAKNEETDGNIPTAMSDIIEVEIKLAEMMHNARILDAYETDSAQNWQKRFAAYGKKFEFMTALSTDFTKAKTTLANNYIIGVHLKNYFYDLAKYLETLDMRKLVNYLGWYFAREIADVLTLEVRESLDKFLRVISKPGVAKELDSNACIEKLIGYHGLMEDGISYLYLQRYFTQDAINKAVYVAKHLNTSFFEMIQANSWMEEKTRKDMTAWIDELEYHMGAPANLLDKEYIKGRYDLVKNFDEESLILAAFALRENNFHQKIRYYKQEYDRRKIWPVSSLATDGRYSEHYISLGMPAGALQNSVFQYSEADGAIFGSMGTLTAEKLSYGFTLEGRLWVTRTGKYAWTRETKKIFNKRLQCLKKKSADKGVQENKKNIDAMERFERRGGDYVLPVKLRDHVGLRTSFHAFKAIMDECSSDCSAFQGDGWKEQTKAFFRSYAHRHCGRDATKEEEHRVNFALKTFEEFSSAFDCQEGDAMKAEDNCCIVTWPKNTRTPSGGLMEGCSD